MIRQLSPCKIKAQKDSEDSEQGRLLRDTLEFNKHSIDEPVISATTSAHKASKEVVSKPGDMLGGKYRVLELLGKGKAGLMYKVGALSLVTGGSGNDSFCAVECI